MRQTSIWKGAELGGSLRVIVEGVWISFNGQWRYLGDHYHAAHIIWLSAGGEASQGGESMGGRCVGEVISYQRTAGELIAELHMGLTLLSGLAEPPGACICRFWELLWAPGACGQEPGTVGRRVGGRCSGQAWWSWGVVRVGGGKCEQ